jgi:hypothetical protein
LQQTWQATGVRMKWQDVQHGVCHCCYGSMGHIHQYFLLACAASQFIQCIIINWVAVESHHCPWGGMAEHSCKFYNLGSAIVNSENWVHNLQGECGTCGKWSTFSSWTSVVRAYQKEGFLHNCMVVGHVLCVWEIHINIPKHGLNVWR